MCANAIRLERVQDKGVTYYRWQINVQLFAIILFDVSILIFSLALGHVMWCNVKSNALAVAH